MNLVHCMIDLRPGAKALGFAAACDAWLSHLAASGAIHGWRLLRRKFGSASGAHADFVLQIEVEELTQLNRTFDALARRDDEAERPYDHFYHMIGRSKVGLYRPYPDPHARERVALI